MHEEHIFEDNFGNELNVGDKILYFTPSGSALKCGIIKKLIYGWVSGRNCDTVMVDKHKVLYSRVWKCDGELPNLDVEEY